jgi:hypothetical protein
VSKREEVTRNWRKLRNEELDDVYCSPNTVEPGYNDIGLCDTSPITSDVLWHQLIPRC